MVGLKACVKAAKMAAELVYHWVDGTDFVRAAAWVRTWVGHWVGPMDGSLVAARAVASVASLDVTTVVAKGGLKVG